MSSSISHNDNNNSNNGGTQQQQQQQQQLQKSFGSHNGGIISRRNHATTAATTTAAASMSDPPPTTTSTTTTATASISVSMRHSSSTGLNNSTTTKNNINNKKGRSMRFWITIILFCIMISYLVIVVVVAITHWPTIMQQIQSVQKQIHHHSPQSISTLKNRQSVSFSRKEKEDLKSVLTTTKQQQQEKEQKQHKEDKDKEEHHHEKKGENEHKGQEKDKKNDRNELEKKEDTNSGKRRHRRRKDIFKMYDLTMNLTHGVKPNVLLPLANPDDLPIAIKEDHRIRNHPTPGYILKAYIEASNFVEWTKQPLPNRSMAQASLLKNLSYPRVHSCSKFIQQFPVDDTPVDHDTFLPWIHDVFPTYDGQYIQIVAQNKRRCRNGSMEKHILAQMQPQASLFQHISVKRVVTTPKEVRYQLVNHDDADPDGIATRFICRFKPSMEETLSVYNFDYDWTAIRKRYKASFLEDDAGIKALHTSQLIFKCPVPESLQSIIRTGASVKNDWASIFLDIIPIRTPPRWGSPSQYLQPQYKTFEQEPKFDPYKVFGTNHIVPKIEDSGRWENIPICKPSLLQYENPSAKDLTKMEEAEPPDQDSTKQIKKHRLVSCIWASAGYTTRGNRFAINDGQRRLLEWISYNKVIGFDHIYVYDNSGAFSNETSLKPVTDLFAPSYVTYIPWPAQICNNNPNNVDSVGERSSQYAAEQSCRLRFGPHVDWIGQFDIDEYLVPMGKHKNVLQLLDELDKSGTRIISFASWRSWPRYDYIDPPQPINNPNVCWHNEPCFDLTIPQKFTMLQAYNCDRQPPGHKTEAMPAEKQVYRADYVTSHFVHYSVATTLSEKNRTEYEKEGLMWKPRAFPDPRQRFANEVTEGLMVHTKAVARQDTAGYERMCHINNTFLPIRKQGLCRLGIPWPDVLPKGPGVLNATADGRAYNCYVNKQVEDLLVPQLEKELAKHANFFKNQQKEQESAREKI